MFIALLFPAEGPFEHNFHVAHRLYRYRGDAGTRTEFATSTPHLIADAMITTLKWLSQRHVESDGGRVCRAHARQFDLVELDRL